MSMSENHISRMKSTNKYIHYTGCCKNELIWRVGWSQQPKTKEHTKFRKELLDTDFCLSALMERNERLYKRVGEGIRLGNSRQVAEVMKILHTTDNILNRKNEYLDNNIPRICVDDSKLDRMKRERGEYEDMYLRPYINYNIKIFIVLLLLRVSWKHQYVLQSSDRHRMTK